MKKLFLLSSLFCIIYSFGYTSKDTSNANDLAAHQIIMKQTVASEYRLDDTILRQEVIGMALKMKGVTLPENYSCKKYFADATKNDWICRALELAADNGIITKNNKYANPGKDVKRAEALAMLMEAGDAEESLESDWRSRTAFSYNPPLNYLQQFADANSWQITLLEKAHYLGLITVDSLKEEQKDSSPYDYIVHLLFYPNQPATRAEVFEFAKNILYTKLARS